MQNEKFGNQVFSVFNAFLTVTEYFSCYLKYTEYTLCIKPFHLQVGTKSSNVTDGYAGQLGIITAKYLGWLML